MPRWTTAEAMLALFWDEETSGLFTTGHDAEALVARQQELLDNATPSASSNAALALARLGILTGEERFTAVARAIVARVAEPALRHPTAFANLLAAADVVANPPGEVVVAGDRPDLVEAVQRRYLPRRRAGVGRAHRTRPSGRAGRTAGPTCARPTPAANR